MNICNALVWCASVLLLAACGGGGGDDSTTTEDPCGNAVGNGNTPISGPAAADGINNFDSSFRSLTVHPTDPMTVYVGTEENGILRSTDGGTTWERLRMGIRHSGTAYPEVYDLDISVSDPSVLIAATTFGPGLASGSNITSIGGVYRSSDGGDTWVRKNCGLPNASVASVYISHVDENVALVGLGAGTANTGGSSLFFPGGIYRTTDSGDNWTQVSLAALEDLNTFYQISGRGSDTVYSFGLDGSDLSNNLGLLISTNTGDSFASITTPFTNSLMTYLTVSADGQRIILMEQDQFELNISDNAGVTWATNTVVGANGPVKISPHDKDHIVIAANEDLWFSDDGLMTASQVVNNAIDFFQDIEFSASDSMTVYAVTRGYDFYRSDDGGQSFNLIVNLRTGVINLQP